MKNVSLLEFLSGSVKYSGFLEVYNILCTNEFVEKKMPVT